MGTKEDGSPEGGQQTKTMEGGARDEKTGGRRQEVLRAGGARQDPGHSMMAAQGGAANQDPGHSHDGGPR